MAGTFQVIAHFLIQNMKTAVRLGCQGQITKHSPESNHVLGLT